MVPFRHRLHSSWLKVVRRRVFHAKVLFGSVRMGSFTSNETPTFGDTAQTTVARQTTAATATTMHSVILRTVKATVIRKPETALT
jgi:hypothetical protein